MNAVVTTADIVWAVFTVSVALGEVLIAWIEERNHMNGAIA